MRDDASSLEAFRFEALNVAAVVDARRTKTWCDRGQSPRLPQPNEQDETARAVVDTC